ncbi:MAG TPA: hypothetical protein VLI67_01705 [Vicinamibacteria bacterium]|nr:hypothetical protein [Vicinamibacteria bacterium]
MPVRRAAGSPAALLGLALASFAPVAAAGDALDARLRLVERAFREGDAAALRPCFAGSSKVRVQLVDISEGEGWYASGQLQVLFARVFEEYATHELAFRDEDVAEPTPGTAFARGVWMRGGRRGGPDITETLVLTLREEKGDWKILEMRTSR